MIVYLGHNMPAPYKDVNLKDWFVDISKPTKEELLFMELEVGLKDIVIDLGMQGYYNLGLFYATKLCNGTRHPRSIRPEEDYK